LKFALVSRLSRTKRSVPDRLWDRHEHAEGTSRVALKMAPCNASEPTQRWGFDLFDNSLHGGDAMNDNSTLKLRKCTTARCPLSGLVSLSHGMMSRCI
jgi:hypothetical protein